MIALARRLADEEIHAIYASDLQRAWETAIAISTHHGVPVHAEPCLREMNFGAWEGLTYDQIQGHYPEILAAWQDEPVHTKTPDGESMADVLARIRPTLNDLTQTQQGQTVLLVAHGGSLQVLLCLALGLAPQTRWQFWLSAASVSELRLYGQGAVLTLLNDVCHLAEVGSDG